MKKISLILWICLTIPLFALAGNTPVIIKANSNAIRYVGRTQALPDGSVRYDWVGVYLQTDFSGGAVSVRISESGKSYHNLFIDGKWMRKIEFTGKNTLVSLASGLSKGFHRLRLQKCTEGENGCTTIHQLILAGGGELKSAPAKSRMIEIYGDSYTCGFGDESNNPSDPFKVETENCNKAYGCILARYFDADYALIAHSGKGMVRNYGDSVRLSKNTMFTRVANVYDDFDPSVVYDFKSYKPDLVLINLGTNDFSTHPVPTDQEYVSGYLKMIQQLRIKYGNVPILCVVPHSGVLTASCQQSLKEAVGGDKNVYVNNPMNDIISPKSDMGACSHPNYVGQRKVAMSLIPRISTIMGWPLMNKVIE